MSGQRHSWGEADRTERKTERACRRCDVVKVTRHEGDEHWVEFWRGPAGEVPERIPGDRTPPCAGGSA